MSCVLRHVYTTSELYVCGLSCPVRAEGANRVLGLFTLVWRLCCNVLCGAVFLQHTLQF